MTDVFHSGQVALIGAGPGDPGLLTVRGAALLAQAEIVVYDYLAPAKLLSYCPQAELIYVGKQAAHHALTQDAINDLLVAKAKLGKRVVRLKGGDPFVFGRGGEECAVLAAAGIAFTVVPGITAAIAAAAYAGIPITHRDFNSGFAIVTGHEKEDDYQDPEAQARQAARGLASGVPISSDIDYPTLAKLPAVAFYMGVKSLPRICEKLIAAGLDPETPAATIQCGTTPRQRTVVATVATLAAEVARQNVGSPAITLVGRVVSLRPTMNWFESLPLFGRTVVVTRTRQQVSEMTEKLEALGATVIEAPTIDIVPPDDWTEVDAAIESLSIGKVRPDWLVFTSAAGVRLTRQRMKQLNLDVRALAGIKVAVVGDKTADALDREFAIQPDCVPARFVAEALATELAARDEIAGKHFVLLRADIARPALVELLTQHGAARVKDIDVYRTRLATELPADLLTALADKRVDWATFTSSSTARNFAALLGPDYAARLAGVRLASIGPMTSQTLAAFDLPVTAQAEVSDIDGLLRAIVQASDAAQAPPV